MKIQIKYTHNSGYSIINTRNVIDCSGGYVSLKRVYYTDFGQRCGDVGNFFMSVDDYCFYTGFHIN